MRRLNLHASALNDAEYDLYTSSLDDLAESHATNDDETNRSYDDAYFDRLSVGVREARAWFRGRYAGVSVADIDSVRLLVHRPYHGANGLLDLEILSPEVGPVGYAHGRTVFRRV